MNGIYYGAPIGRWVHCHGTFSIKNTVTYLILNFAPFGIIHFPLVTIATECFRFGHKTPLHINVIRDPLDRKVSSYYYRRSIEMRKDAHIHEEDVQNFNMVSSTTHPSTDFRIK